MRVNVEAKSLRPILFHIILKLLMVRISIRLSLRPILFHIILKPLDDLISEAQRLRPILFHIILKPRGILDAKITA